MSSEQERRQKFVEIGKSRQVKVQAVKKQSVPSEPSRKQKNDPKAEELLAALKAVQSEVAELNKIKKDVADLKHVLGAILMLLATLTTTGHIPSQGLEAVNHVKVKVVATPAHTAIDVVEITTWQEIVLSRKTKQCRHGETRGGCPRGTWSGQARINVPPVCKLYKV